MNEILIERELFKVWPKSFYPKTTKANHGIGSILSIYSPWFIDGSEREVNGDCTTAVTFGIFEDSKQRMNLVLFSMFTPTPNINPGDLIIHCKNLSHNYMNNSLMKTYDGYAPDIILIPAEAASKNAISSEVRKNIKTGLLRSFYYNQYGGNLESMLIRAMPRICQGRIWVVCKPGYPDQLRSMDKVFLALICNYPNTAESNALAWSLSQAILFLDGYNAFDEVDERKKEFFGPKDGVYGVIK